MTDRELLEAAAKAAGHTITDWRETYHGVRPALSDHPIQGQWIWNPLNDDGDALRLAVRLRITPNIDCNLTEAEAATQVEGGFFAEPHLDDPYAATRRAIVRAAAAMAA